MKYLTKKNKLKPCCLTCNAFCWWDGDYCCTMHMQIHQYGYGPQNGNANWFNEDIEKTMATPKTCEDYSQILNPNHPKWNEYLTQYQKFREWQDLIDNYEAHIQDKSGVYQLFKNIGIV